MIPHLHSSTFTAYLSYFINIAKNTLIIILASAAISRAQIDGSMRWAFSTVSSSTIGAIVSSPSVGSDGTVYIGMQLGDTSSTNPGGRVFAVAPNGVLKWSYSTADWVDSSPAVGSDGSIYFGCWDSYVYALRPDGTLKWKFKAGTYLSSSPSIGPNGEIYIGCGNGLLYALNSDGSQKWTFPTLFWIDSTPSVAPDGTIYVTSLDNSIYAVNPDGTQKWVYSAGNDIVSAPAIAGDGSIYFGSRDLSLHALKPSGELKWTFRIADTIESSPIIGDNGTIYFASTGGRVYAINPDGTEQWRYPSAGNPSLSSIYSSPALRRDGSIVCGSSDNAIFALKQNGTLLWTTAVGDWTDSSPTIASDGTIFIGSYDKKLYCINGTEPASATDWPQLGRDPKKTSRQPMGAVPGTTGRLINLSVRATAGAGGETLIVGLVTKGNGKRSLLIRGIGPTLANFGVTKSADDPQLLLFNGSTEIDSNDDWGKSPASAALAQTATNLGAFQLPAQSADSALFRSLTENAYTVQLTSKNGPGVALIEVYDSGGDASSRLINVAARTTAGTGPATLIAGFVVSESSRSIMIRAIGPTLNAFNVPGVLVDPHLRIYRGNELIAENNDWGKVSSTGPISAMTTKVGAFALPPTSSDAVLLMTLEPGAYTAQISGNGGSSGVALVEIYEVP